MRFALRVPLALAVPLVFTACASIGPPMPPSLDLPKPPSDLQGVRKGDQVILIWTIPTRTTDRQTINNLGPTEICRGLLSELTECGTPVGRAAPVQIATPHKNNAKQKTSESYTDTLPAQVVGDVPSATITYGVEVLNRENRGAGLSNQIRVPLIRTLPPPENFKAQVTSQGVVLNWSGASAPSIPQVHFAYRVYRRKQDQQQAMVVGDLPVGSETNYTLTDSEIEWEKIYEYYADAITIIAEPNKPEVKVEGADSPQVKVFADDVFPPSVPIALQAVFSGPGQKPFIDLIWAPDTDADLAGYNVYRRTERRSFVKINAELVKMPSYRDSNIEAGHTYFYSVSAVDVRGNESARSEESSEEVP
ncbi:MAG TPA: fibronectin type III domain-containing protein [Candidatus Acidoferrales bacterium]|nr:fibronectin type III domain-containing protein [Candidatus Acidoferrales bacterium]